ncbi:serpin family protein [Mucilaginibacter sp. SMC90]|uniref:serpin family protein n=1 Tax=Mucilaginibacter sp. SMC90 TaxID=2929803 RepID=UPI001FB4F796|nr:serpin family protein [Mucilaginibacter sp. SMC90]UOE50261.1 serpin family protein [Mucilaginibacter sp. SMC90]
MMRKITLLGLGILAITACKKGGNGPINNGPGKDLVLSAIEQQQIGPGNAFTLKLFKANVNTVTDNQNLIVSPLSVSFAMGMTSNGASGQTLTDIRKTMDFDGFTEDQVNAYHHNLITNLPDLDPNTTLKIANSIWYANNFTPLPAFIKTNTDFYNAEVKALDFTDKTGSTNTINSWVSGQTNNKITKIIYQVADGARMYLINAIYFKSSWKKRFDAAKTYKAPFHLSSSSTVQADFMTNNDVDLKAAFTDDASVVELPYSNSKYSMVMIMPDADLKTFALGLDSAKWNLLMSKLTNAKSTITLPKFKFSYGIDLKDILKSLGMSIAFSDQADFSRISGSGLTITEVKHKAYIDVNEDGTEAAAVTSVGVGLTAAPTKNIVLDKPFIFAIREMKTGLILFAGIVNDPTKSE